MSDVWWMTRRRLTALARQPWAVLMSLVQPAIWLFLFGGLFRRVVELPGFGAGSYLDYLVPGVVVMNAVSWNTFAGMAVLDDIERGTLDRFLVSPVGRGALAGANVIEQAVSTVAQSLVIVGLGLLGGAEFAGGAAGIAVLVAVAVLVGAVVAALSNTVGLLARQREAVIGLNITLLLPLTLLSTAFMAEGLMPGWIRAIGAYNPVDWAVEAARAALAADPDWAAAGRYGAGLLALAVATGWAATGAFGGYQKAL